MAILADTSSDYSLSELRDGIERNHPAAVGRLFQSGSNLVIPFDVFSAIQQEDWFYALIQEYTQGLYNDHGDGQRRKISL